MARRATDWTRHALGVLDANGHRTGGARTAVIELMGAQGGCLTADEVAERLRERGKPIGMASVYRALTLMADLGLLQRVPLGPGPVRYDLVEPAGEHHHHLVCDRCGRMTPFEDGGLEALIEQLSARVAYRVESHDVTLRGTCPSCSSAAEAG